MATALFFNIPAHGHVNPTLPLVSELARRGERVVYYGHEAFREKVEATGAIFRGYGDALDFSVGQPTRNPADAMARLLSAAERLIPAMLDRARADRPDYILYDSMCVWGKQIAQILQRPAICSCTIFFIGSQNYGALPRDGLIRKQMLLTFPGTFWRLTQRAATARRLAQRYGVSTPAFLDFFVNPGDITLVYTSRYFQTGAERLDETFKFIGPSIAERGDGDGFPFDRLAGGPAIYISLGTIFNERPEFYRRCIEAFRDSRFRVAMSIGDKLPPDSLGAIPENFIVRSHVPQLEVLKRAALFVTHGGMNSVSEGLWHGVPLIVAPQMGDQLYIAQRVEALGAGRRIDSNAVTPAQLRALAERVLADESFRRQSQIIGESFRAAGGYRRAADELLAFRERV